MSEPTKLIPNHNKIMEEYAEREEGTVQATQAETRRSEERMKVNKELEQPVEESKKRKRGDEEEIAESNG